MPLIDNREVGPIGYGLMGLSWRDQPPPQEQAFEAMRTALAQGCNCWNGGEFYGPVGANSLVLLERYLEQYPEDADKLYIQIKGGLHSAERRVDGSPENTRRTIDDCIAQLKGRKRIDAFEFARRDPNVPLEVTLGVIDREYVQTGKIGGIALSEVRAETIHEAVKITRIVAVEVELSLFSTEILDNGVAAACAQYGIPLIAYSPIGRGMLSGKIRSINDLPDPMMRHYPRFQPGNFEINLQLVDQVEAMASRKCITPAQLAINWTRAIARRPGMPVIIPIPGATTAARVKENSLVVELTDAEMAELDDTLSRFTPAGTRYPAGFPVDT